MAHFDKRAPRAPATAQAPLDQADGLRRLFAGRRRSVIPLAANPHGASSARMLDSLAAQLAAQGRHVLVVDAASTSPLPHELHSVDLSACVLHVATRVSYLAARSLPMEYVDTRGSSGAFIDAAQAAAPQADVLLLHADGVDLARLLKRRAVRPVLLAADHPESIKHAYANAKLLVRRCELMTFDLLLSAAQRSPRAEGITQSLAGCLDTFLGAVLRHAALLDLEAPSDARGRSELGQLLTAQLALYEAAPPDNDRWAPPVPSPAARAAAAPTSRPAFR
jgi:flagellar biosynthesis protein FlhG